MKTIGKLVDEKITPEGLFTIVLKTAVSDGKYAFVTQNNGKDTVKSPEGMFTTYAINNDLKYVDEKIRNYYELGDSFLSDEEMAEIDEEAKNVDFEPPKPKEERKRRGSRNEEASEEQSQPERKQRKSREEVQADNSAKLANAGIEEAQGADEVEFDKVETPELETPPRRRRRRTE